MGSSPTSGTSRVSSNTQQGHQTPETQGFLLPACRDSPRDFPPNHSTTPEFGGAAPEPSALDTLIHRMQDKHVDTKRPLELAKFGGLEPTSVHGLDDADVMGCAGESDEPLARPSASPRQPVQGLKAQLAKQASKQPTRPRRRRDSCFVHATTLRRSFHASREPPRAAPALRRRNPRVIFDPCEGLIATPLA